MDHILGQDQAIRILLTALRSDHLPHALIFHGPEGVGKFTTAIAFARLLLCHGSQTRLDARACGQCASCQLLATSDDAVHPDLHIVTKEMARYSDDKTIRDRKLTSIPVEILRSALIEPVHRSGQLRHQKCFIIDEAELLQPAGQNLLLKTLEEPPDGTYIILVTSNDDRLLPTVRSRCQRIAFRPLSDKVVSHWLDGSAAGLPTDKHKALLRFASGSLGRLKVAMDYDLPGWTDLLPQVDAMTQQRFPADLGTSIAQRIDQFAKDWVAKHENASKEAANRYGASLMWSMFGQHARNQLNQLAEACDAADQESCQVRLEPWLSVIDAIQSGEQELSSNVNMGLVTDHVVSLFYRALS